MGKTIIPNKLNHKPQAHARVCEENEEKENDCPLKFFMVKGPTLESHKRAATIRIQLIFVTTTLYTIKVIVLK